MSDSVNSGNGLTLTLGDPVSFKRMYSTFVTVGYECKFKKGYTWRQREILYQMLLYNMGYVCDSVDIKAWGESIVEFQFVEEHGGKLYGKY